MSKREELEKDSKAYMSSLQNQMERLKGDFQKIGKSALWIGGGLFATYLVVDTLTGKKDKKKKEAKKTKAKAKGVKSGKPNEDNLLIAAVKEQALVFLLGLAAQQLSKFLSELDSEDEKENS